MPLNMRSMPELTLKRLSAFAEDARRVAVIVMAFGFYALILYKNRWPEMLLALVSGIILWFLAYEAERRLKCLM